MRSSSQSSDSIKISAGGIANSSGADYENRVAAWFAVNIMAERDVALPWGLSSNESLEKIRLQTEFPIDDAFIITSTGRRIFIQIKHNLSVTKSPQSSLSKAISQIVRQYLVPKLENTLDPSNIDLAQDRFVIVTSSDSSPRSINTIDSLLTHLRSQSERVILTKKEQNCWNVVRQQASHFFYSLSGKEPTEDQIKTILRSVYLTILDVDKDSKDELNCKSLLRSAILKKPEQADLVWGILISHCAELARTRGGSDRNQLQFILSNNGIDLNVPHSLRGEVDALREYTRFTLDIVSPLSKIYLGTREIKVTRRYVQGIIDAAKDSHLLIIGEPGSGKSGVLHDLVDQLVHEEDVVFFAVDKLGSSSLLEEMNLSSPIQTLLQNWPGTRPGYLIIDALDGARNEQTAQFIQTLIETIIKHASRWHVIASVRKFDLRHNPQLRSCFLGKPIHEDVDPEFSNIRHVNIQNFDEDELKQIISQSDSLASLLQTTIKDAALRSLLKSPFNLRLVGELFGEGVSPTELTPIRTQVELLSRYWSYRIVKTDAYGDAREFVLRRVAAVMLENYSMRADRSSVITDAVSSMFLKELLSSHVLVEWQPSPWSKADRSMLAFPHNMLFDYAISKLVFDLSGQDMIKMLERDHDLVLAFRPSIIYRFIELWYMDPQHDRFWQTVLDLMKENQVPLVGKLIGPSVSVDLASKVSDFDRIFILLEGNNRADTLLAYKVIRDITGAFLTSFPDNKDLSPIDLDLWTQVVERLSISVGREIAYSLRAVIFRLCNKPAILQDNHKEFLGRASRRLLSYAWSQEEEKYDEGLVVVGLMAVCRTYESDRSASKELICHSLELGHLEKHGYKEMPRVADEIEHILESDPKLVEEIYTKTFVHVESSEEKTNLGGKILSFTSTRRQDYDMARFQLAEKYQYFLEKAPIEAIGALIEITQSYIVNKEKVSITQNILTFNLLGIESKMIADHSYIWDYGGGHHGDETLRMIDVFTNYLERKGTSSSNDELTREIVSLIARKNTAAVIWNKLLIAASRERSHLGSIVRSLAWTKPILLESDTTVSAGNFLHTIYPHLSQDEKSQVEEVIFSIAFDEDFLEREHAEKFRNRLLGCISEYELVSPKAIALVHQLNSTEGFPKNSPLFSIGTGWGKEYTDEDFLSESGVSIEAPKYERILQLQKRVKQFASDFQKNEPTIPDAEKILSTILELEDLLTKDSESVDKKLKNLAWGYILQACERMTTIYPLARTSQLGGNIERILIFGANYPVPPDNPRDDEQFKKFQAWGSPSPRIDAAAGLIMFARCPDNFQPLISDSLKRLIRDNVAAVRFQIVSRMNVLINIAPEFMWDSLKYVAEKEMNEGVIQGVFYPLHRLAGAHPNEVVSLATSIFNRMKEGEGTDSISDACISIFTGLYVWQGHEQAGNQLDHILGKDREYFRERNHIVDQLRDALHDFSNNDVRARARSILERIITDDLRWFQIYKDRLNRQENLTEDEVSQVREIIRLADSAAMTIYFSSGAFAEKQKPESTDERLSNDEKASFFNETSPLLQSLCQIHYASVTHNIVRTLESVISGNPSGVFLLLGHVVRAGKEGGYQFEFMAVDDIVKIVERYLAEYRLLLRENIDCRNALLEILDTFVDAGWPNARRLTYRLEEIFR